MTGYGVGLSMLEASGALDHTRLMRMALYLLVVYQPPELDSDDLRDALRGYEDRLVSAETAALRQLGHTDYLIVKALSPLNPPPPDVLAKITAALTTLDDLGMLVTVC